MQYPDFIRHVEETARQEQLVLRALGMTAASERFTLSNYVFTGLTQPTIAVLSTPEEALEDRDYRVLATATHKGAFSFDFPVVNAPAVQRPRPDASAFKPGRYDPVVANRYVSLNTLPGEFAHRHWLGYLEGSVGSLVVNGNPTFPPEVAELHDAMQ